MKIIRSTPKPNGVTRLVIELDADEHIVNYDGDQKVLVTHKDEDFINIKPSAHYRLGEPMHDDVIAGHILADTKRVRWCSLEQKWV